ERKDNVVALSSKNDSITAQTMPSLKEALEELTGSPFTFIDCGGSKRSNQFREQWTDGANFFSIAPGLIVGYERNTHTFRELKEHGYRLLNQFEFIEEYSIRPFDPDEDKIAISFVGNELRRGRCGARCMTMTNARAK